MMISRYRPALVSAALRETNGPLCFGDFLRSQAHPFDWLRAGSGPLLDRSAQPFAPLKTLSSLSLCEIDIHIKVPRVEYDPVVAGRTIAYGLDCVKIFGETGGNLTDDRPGEPSAAIRARTEGGREVQRGRFSSAGGEARASARLLTNTEMPA